MFLTSIPQNERPSWRDRKEEMLTKLQCVGPDGMKGAVGRSLVGVCLLAVSMGAAAAPPLA